MDMHFTIFIRKLVKNCIKMYSTILKKTTRRKKKETLNKEYKKIGKTKQISDGGIVLVDHAGSVLSGSVTYLCFTTII